jgi:hypothetical protein
MLDEFVKEESTGTGRYVHALRIHVASLNCLYIALPTQSAQCRK